jgi:hypothetical protein
VKRDTKIGRSYDAEGDVRFMSDARLDFMAASWRSRRELDRAEDRIEKAIVSSFNLGHDDARIAAEVIKVLDHGEDLRGPLAEVGARAIDNSIMGPDTGRDL